MIVLIRIQDAFIPLPLQSYGNFDSICMFLHGYELFRTDQCSFELVVGGLGGCEQFRMGGCEQFWVVGMVSGGYRSFWIVSDGLSWFRLVCRFSGYVFRVYETRKKFNYLIHTTSEKKTHTIRDLSSFFILLRLKRKITSKHFIHQFIQHTIQLSISKLRLIASFLLTSFWLMINIQS